MTKDDVLGVLLGNIRQTIPELASDELDSKASFDDLGITSLELVELVVKTSKQLAIGLSPAALASVRTLDDLANALLKLQTT